MTKRCPEPGCDRPFDEADTFCPDHLRPLELVDAQADSGVPAPPAATAQDGDPRPDPDGHQQPGSEPVCWNCGRPVSHPTNTECTYPDCRRPLTPPALVIRFSDGQVEVQPGSRAELGRHGAYGRVFRRFPNVSRQHTVVGVDRDGYAWIEPIRTPNGTFIDGAEVEASMRHTLRTGHVVRLARSAEGTVTVFNRDGDRA